MPVLRSRGSSVLVAVTTLAACAAGLVLALAPAQADDVQVLRGTGFTTDETYLTYVGCQSFHGPVSPPQLRINRGPAAAPLGARSFGLVPSGTGTASGSFVRLASMGTGTSVIAVHATAGASGVSWAWVRAADTPGTQAWLGRAAVSVPAGSWQHVDAASLTYSWSLVDLGTGATTATDGPATLGAFTAEHGDGEGFVVTGFGCDGRSVNVDAVRGGDRGDVTTYDLEGMVLRTTASASTQRVAPGAEVELTATVVDGVGRPTGDLVVLESRSPGGAWRTLGAPLAPGRDGVARVTVRPEATTEYRWFRPDGEYADQGWSEPVLVTTTQ